MNFSILHPSILALAFALYAVARSQWQLERKKYKTFTLEQLVYGIVISIFWIGYGVYEKVDSLILALEGFAVCLVMLQLVTKLNLPGKHKFLGRDIPGHGSPEGRKISAVKKIVFYITAAITFLVVAAAIILALDVI